MIITAGLAADLDWATYWLGPRTFLAGHRTFLHSLLAAFVIAALVAGAFYLIANQIGKKNPNARISFTGALTVCVIAAAVHLLLDLANPWGLKLLWPFRENWMAWDLLDEVDPWLIAIFLLGVLLPQLFRLVGEEIGARKKSGEAAGAILALIAAVCYMGGRAVLHANALAILHSRLYHGEVSRAAGAFPHSGSPFTWSGVVETETAIYQIEVSSASAAFDPEQAQAQYKPEPSAALESARSSSLAADFLKFARFPKATVEPTEGGFKVRLSDLRFAGSHSSRLNPVVVMDLDRQAKVLHEDLRF